MSYFDDLLAKLKSAGSDAAEDFSNPLTSPAERAEDGPTPEGDGLLAKLKSAGSAAAADFSDPLKSVSEREEDGPAEVAEASAPRTPPQPLSEADIQARQSVPSALGDAARAAVPEALMNGIPGVTLARGLSKGVQGVSDFMDNRKANNPYEYNPSIYGSVDEYDKSMAGIKAKRADQAVDDGVQKTNAKALADYLNKLQKTDAPAPTAAQPPSTQASAPAEENGNNPVSPELAKKRGWTNPSSSEPAPAAKQEDVVAKYLADLKSARAEQNSNTRNANMAEGIGQIFSGISSSSPMDTKFYDNLRKQASAPVDAVEGNLDMTNKAMKLHQDQQNSDPKSEANIAFRSAIQKVLPPGTNIAGVTLANPGPFEKIAQFYQQAEAKKAAMAQTRELMAQRLDSTNGRMQETRDERAHQNNIRAIKSSPSLQKRLTQIQNLDNNMAMIEQADNITPQQIQELQQGIRANLGIKGQSGVDERESTYYKKLGWKSADIQQFLTGNPAQISTNDALVGHIKQLARIERGNAQKQFDAALNTVSGGNDQVYARQPEKKAGLDNLVNSFRAQSQTNPMQGAASSKDEAALKWASDPANANDPRAAQIKSLHGIR